MSALTTTGQPARLFESASPFQPAPLFEATPLFLREPQVLVMVPISPATLWRWVKAKKFPAPIKLSVGVTAWRVSDVEAWARDFKSNS